MESLCLEEENMTKNIRNPFRLKKELNYTAIEGIRNLFRLEKETKAIKDIMFRDIRNLFEREEDYYKPVIRNNFQSKIILNIKVRVIENYYQLKNILIKLNHT